MDQQTSLEKARAANKTAAMNGTRKQRSTLKHYTLQDVADAVGISRKTLQRYLKQHSSAPAIPIQQMELIQLVDLIILLRDKYNPTTEDKNTPPLPPSKPL
jgi:AraC-like DNA-binding protein